MDRRLLPIMVLTLMSAAFAESDYELAPLPDRGWRLVTDGVMGGVSTAKMSQHAIQDRACVALKGTVSTDNNGGFVQIVREIGAGDPSAMGFAGIALEVIGNGERYNLHLRTSDLWLPWQSYRASFPTSSEWTRVLLPFSDFEAYRTGSTLRLSKLRRIGIVAIGREFEADVCVRALAFYRPNEDAGR